MNCIYEIEEEIDNYIKKNNLNGPTGIFIVLSRTFINNYCDMDINSICLHLATKYKGMQWPKLCVDNTIEVVLFIGRG